jgi:hypothetical protein
MLSESYYAMVRFIMLLVCRVSKLTFGIPSGAKLHMKDAYGESAFDCAKDSVTRHQLELASSTWVVANADVFPIPFRSAGKTLLLIQRRQQALYDERLRAMKRELARLRPVHQRSAAEAKMRYDESARLAHAQVTLLKKVDLLIRADNQFDDERADLLSVMNQAILAKVEADTRRVLSYASIATILSFCGRHWFDSFKVRHQHKQIRADKHQSIEMAPPQPVARKRKGVQSVSSESIEYEWIDLQRKLGVRV